MKKKEFNFKIFKFSYLYQQVIRLSKLRIYLFETFDKHCNSFDKALQVILILCCGIIRVKGTRLSELT